MADEEYMLDTNLFNALADGQISLSALFGKRLFVTHIQLDELRNTKDIERREKIFAMFEKVGPDQLITSGANWDVSKWDKAEWTDGDLIERMRPGLEELDKNSRKEHRRGKTADNQARDLLMGATAIKNGLTLVTNDRNLRTVVQQFGGRAIDATEFIAR